MTCRITEDLKKMFGYAHAVRILAIIEIVLDSISILGLFLLAFPIAGKRITDTWNDSDIRCVTHSRIHLCVV